MAETRVVKVNNEIWKSINGFPDYYISNLGRVKSFKSGEGLIRKLTKDGKGYYRVCFGKNGKQYTKKVHRLVAEAFLDNPNNLPEVNHIDTNKGNNLSSNLEWADRPSNIRHAVLNNIMPSGSKNGSSKLKESDIPEIKRLHNTEGVSQRKIAIMYSVSYPTINRIINGRKWRKAI